MREVGFHHFSHERVERVFWLPTKCLCRLRRVADKYVDFRRSEIFRVDFDDGLRRLLVNTPLRSARALPRNLHTERFTRLFGEFAHAVRLSRRKNEIVRPVVLQYAPHALDVIGGVTPVAFRVEVTEIQCFGFSEFDAGETTRNLA